MLALLVAQALASFRVEGAAPGGRVVGRLERALERQQPFERVAIGAPLAPAGPAARAIASPRRPPPAPASPVDPHDVPVTNACGASGRPPRPCTTARCSASLVASPAAARRSGPAGKLHRARRGRRARGAPPGRAPAAARRPRRAGAGTSGRTTRPGVPRTGVPPRPATSPDSRRTCSRSCAAIASRLARARREALGQGVVGRQPACSSASTELRRPTPEPGRGPRPAAGAPPPPQDDDSRPPPRPARCVW